MSLVNILNMIVLDNPTCFTSPFQFEITFECLENLHDDLEFKVLYVKNPQEDASTDLVLDEILVGPVVTGVHSFVACADAPRRQDLHCLLGITAVLVTCSYRDQEFCRIGLYVNNEHDPPQPHPPSQHGTTTTTCTTANHTCCELVVGQKEDYDDVDEMSSLELLDEGTIPLSQVVRTILADKPRVTRFPIQWRDFHTTTTMTTESNSTPMKLSHDAMMEPTTTTLPKLVSPSHHVDMQL